MLDTKSEKLLRPCYNWQMYIGAALLLSSAVLMACGGSGSISRPYAKPSALDLVGEIEARQALGRSFIAESRMEYWSLEERVKTTVLVMGERGAKVRFNALNPTGGDVAADLACNGSDFQFVDFNHDCQLTGPCSKDAIAQLLRVSLAPDDFLILAIGSTPIIAFDEGKVRWDPKEAREIVVLTTDGGGRRQEIVLDGHDKRWDVLSSTVWEADGSIAWRLTNKNFSIHTSEDNKPLRLPARTRFEQPQTKSDLAIRWDERNINAKLTPEKFEMDLPNLPRCGE